MIFLYQQKEAIRLFVEIEKERKSMTDKLPPGGVQDCQDPARKIDFVVQQNIL